MLRFPPPFTIVCQPRAKLTNAHVTANDSNNTRQAFDRVSSDVIDMRAAHKCLG